MIENRPSVISGIITPFVGEKRRDGPAIYNHLGEPVQASYGMHEDGYDIRLRDPVTCIAGRMVFGLALEHVQMPLTLRARCDDKSTNLRLGIRVAGRAAPGWHGHLTIEVMYVPIEGGPSVLALPAEWPIATLEFSQLVVPGDYGAGKYQGAMEIQVAR
jgi:deoxycytidine triphosphate deaminase